MFRWFINCVSERFSSDKELTFHLRLATYTNGVALDLVHEKDPKLAIRMLDALSVVARGIAAGDCKLPEGGQFGTETQEDCKRIFADLADLLDRCEFNAQRHK